MHADQRYRGSLATNLMEPVRPITDSLVLDRLDSTICPEGTCTRNPGKACAASVRGWHGD
jgi:CRISPR/Cas system-associated endonuclease Cas1